MVANRIDGGVSSTGKSGNLLDYYL